MTDKVHVKEHKSNPPKKKEDSEIEKFSKKVKKDLDDFSKKL